MPLPVLAAIGNALLNPWVLSTIAGIGTEKVIDKLTDNEVASTTAGVAAGLLPFSLGKKQVEGYVANLPDYENMTPHELRKIEVLGRKGMLPPVTTTKSMVEKFGFKMPGKLALAMTALPLGSALLSYMTSDNKTTNADGTKSTDPIVKDALAQVNPDVTDEAIKSNIDLLRDSIKRTEIEANKTIAPLLNIANSYISPTALSGINMNRVNTLVDTYKQKSVDAAAMAAIGSLYVMSGQQGGLDMVKTGTLLSSEMMGKWKNLLSTQDVLKNGTAEQKKVASVMIHNELGELEAMGVSNKDALGALEAAMNVKSKYDLQIEQLKINIEKLGSMKGKGAVDENGLPIKSAATSSEDKRAIMRSIESELGRWYAENKQNGTLATKEYLKRKVDLEKRLNQIRSSISPELFAGSKEYGNKPTFSAEQLAMIKG